jgi:uncharacterized protein
MIVTHPNVEMLRGLDEAMLRGDMDTFFSGYTDDVATHLAGTSPLAGDYRGLDQLKQVFGRFMEASGEYTFENHAYLADDEHGIILQRGTMKKRGRTLTTDEVFVIHFRDGKVRELWYLPYDQAGVDAWISG